MHARAYRSLLPSFIYPLFQRAAGRRQPLTASPSVALFPGPPLPLHGAGGVGGLNLSVGASLRAAGEELLDQLLAEMTQQQSLPKVSPLDSSQHTATIVSGMQPSMYRLSVCLTSFCHSAACTFFSSRQASPLAAPHTNHPTPLHSLLSASATLLLTLQHCVHQHSSLSSSVFEQSQRQMSTAHSAALLSSALAALEPRHAAHRPIWRRVQRLVSEIHARMETEPSALEPETIAHG